MNKCLLSIVFLLLFSGCNLISEVSNDKVETLDDWIFVDHPKEESEASCPLHISGSARGGWYFEASFPVQLLAADGTVIASATAHALGDWMTEDYVPFEVDIYYETANENGTLVLNKSNPSGLEENDLRLEIPIKLSSCEYDVLKEYQHGLVENYIRENIESLSPVDPVLGGAWYVIKVDFPENNLVSVVYEDGHIQESFEAEFTLDLGENVMLNFQGY